MTDVPLRFSWLRRLGALVAVIGTVSGVSMLVAGVVLLVSPSKDERWIVTGSILLFGGIVCMVFSILAYGILLLLLKVEGTVYRIHGEVLDLEDRVTTMAEPVKAVAENTEISDSAKTIAHRAKEREAVRNAIREEILHQDWEAAYYLIHQMERRFGYHQEAQRIRREVETSRQETIERMIVEAMHHIEDLCNKRLWPQARTEADRLVRLFPNHDEARTAGDLVDRKREDYKAELLRAYNEAFSRNESEKCVLILKELDPFLTRSEAEAIAESARGVFRAQLHNLGVQFSLAVAEQRWREALETGLKITGNFPNSRMAEEVRGKLDILQKRAGLSASTIADAIEQKPHTTAQPTA